MTLKEFDYQLQHRMVAIRTMASKDIMGARREVDQLRREFVTVLAGTEGQWVMIGLPREIAKELDELDKFDMPTKNIPRKKKKFMEPKEWVERQFARAGKHKGRDTSFRDKPIEQANENDGGGWK